MKHFIADISLLVTSQQWEQRKISLYITWQTGRYIYVEIKIVALLDLVLMFVSMMLVLHAENSSECLAAVILQIT